MVVADVAEIYSRATLAAYRSWRVCLSYAPSRAEAFADSHSAHSALFINTQTQDVLFIRQSDRDQWGVRRRACSKRRLCQASEDMWGVCVLLNI